MSTFVDAVDFDAQISCMTCGQEGWVTWTRNTANHARWRTVTSPVKTSDGFYLRTATPTFANPHIVCARCGAVHRDRVV
jgi:hypothetical protein